MEIRVKIGCKTILRQKESNIYLSFFRNLKSLTLRLLFLTNFFFSIIRISKTSKVRWLSRIRSILHCNKQLHLKNRELHNSHLPKCTISLSNNNLFSLGKCWISSYNVEWISFSFSKSEKKRWTMFMVSEIGKIKG